MNPKRAFEYRKEKTFSIFLLALILLFQISYYLFRDAQIVIPKKIINLISDKNESLFINDFTFSINKDFKIKNIEKEFNGNYIVFENLFFSSNTLIPSGIDDIKIFKIKNICVNKIEGNINVTNFELLARDNDLLLKFELNFDQVKFNVNGTVKKEHIKDLFLTKKSNPNEINHLIDKFFLEYNTGAVKSLINKKSDFLVNFEINEDLKLRIHQTKHPGKIELIQGLTFQYFNSFKKNKISDFDLSVESILVENQKKGLLISNLSFRKLSDNKILHDNNYYFSVKETKFIGNITGKLPKYELHLNDTEESIKAILNSEANNSKISNEFYYTKDSEITQHLGIIKLNPTDFDLKISDKNSSKKIISGKNLTLIFKKDLDHISQVNLRTENFSVLESPPCNLKGDGIIDQNFSIILNNLGGEIGNSSAIGSFKQKISPYYYFFDIKGNCLPTDLNSWFGEWWKNIWLDFNFSEENIPYGDFSISGIWNDPNAISVKGEIVAKNITYKDFKIDHSNFQLITDRNSTFISSNNIKHKNCLLKGYLNIPSKKSNYNYLNFKLDGLLPINESKKVFGSIVENYITDFNTSNLKIYTQGKIPFNYEKSYQPDLIDYNISITSNSNGKWRGVSFDSFNCDIKFKNNRFQFIAPTIKQANADLLLNFDINAKGNYKIYINLTNGKISNILNSVKNYQLHTSSEYISNQIIQSSEKLSGKLNLNFNGNGTSSNISELKATGKVRIEDKNLKEIHFFGILSEKLSLLPIPLPLGSLNFNTLEGIFRLDKKILHADNLELTGIFSKLSNKGSVNLESGIVDISSKLHLIGNIPIPVIKQIVNFADPLSRIAEIKLTGHWYTPDWKIQINPVK